MPGMDRIARYELIEVLGRGAVSTVYRARDPVIGREVALKTLDLASLGPRSAEYRLRFEREARAAGQLAHPGIVTVYDVGEAPDRQALFLAMEHIDGGTLRDAIEARVPVEPWHAAELGARLAEALQAAHDADIVHRDVKPANVLLGSDGAVKLTDFGIARLGISDLTRSGATVGTPYYMAPEQITAQPVDGRADLYALGVILYELLAGRRPFAAEAIGELVHRITTETPPALGSLRPELPELLTSVVDRCLAKRPEDRPQSGRALAAALREAWPTPAGPIELPWARPAAQQPPHSADILARTLPGDPMHTREMDVSPTTLTAGSSRSETAPGRRWPLVALGVAGAALAMTAALLVWAPDPTGRTTLDDNAGRFREAAVKLQQGYDTLEAGNPEGALAAAAAVLAAAPGSPAAQELFARSHEELERRRPERLERRPEASTRAPVRLPSARPAAALPTPTIPAPAPPPPPPVLSIQFASPLPEGSLVVKVDGKRLDELRWDFTAPGALGLRRGEGGQVTGRLDLPVGQRRLRLELHAGRRGQIASEELELELEPGSRWRLTVHMDSRRATPRFALEPDDAVP